MIRVALTLVATLAMVQATPSRAADTLSAVWAEAVARNAEVSAAELERSATAFDVAAARAGRAPAAYLSGGYTVRSDERSFIFDNPVQPGQSFTSPYAQREGAGAAASVRLPIYTGGATTSSIEAAEARLTSASHRSAVVRMDLMLAVGESYLAVLRGERSLQVAECELKGLQAHEREVAQRLAHQQIPGSEYLSAQVAVAQAEQLRLRRVHELEVARASYNRLLGRPLETPVALEELVTSPLPNTVAELQQTAFQNRAELAELQAAADARRCEAERLRGAVRPQVAVIGRHDFDENRYQTPQGVSTAGVVVDWSVYDGGRSRRAAAGEEQRALSLTKLLEDLRSRIALEVLTYKQAEAEALARQMVAAKAISNADESLRVSQLRYTQGLAVSSEVLDAQTQRSKAAYEYFHAIYDAQLAGLRVRHAAGILGTVP